MQNKQKNIAVAFFALVITRPHIKIISYLPASDGKG